jgi:hypothetical protein
MSCSGMTDEAFPWRTYSTVHNHSTTFISQLMRPGVLSFSAYQLILEVLVCGENRPNIFLGNTRTEPELLLLVHQQN